MRNKLFYGLLLAPVILLGLLSIVATGGGNGDDNGDVDGNRLSFVIKNDMRSEQPLQGVTIALYDTDDRTIVQTKISDANGVVDFGDIGRNRATFTIAYEDMSGKRFIVTNINVLVAENVIFYTDTNNPISIATVDLSLSNIPANAGYTMLDPFWDTYQNHLDGSDKLTNIPVYTFHLQNDGKLSLLAMTYDDISMTTLTDYGYLLDQTVTNGANYDISLHRKPLNLDWTTSPVTVLDSLFISGRRDDVFYGLAQLFHDKGPQTTSGSIPFPHEFPVDNYMVYAEADSDATRLSSYTNHDTLAQPILIPLPDYSVDSFDYAEATRTFDWKITGNSPRDYVSLNFVSFDDAEQLLEWTVNMAEDASGWQIIDLPAPANTWVDTTDIVNSVDIEVIVCDLDNVSNNDQLWQLIRSGKFTVETFQYLYCGSRDLAQKTMTTNSADKALTSPRTQDAYIRNMSGLLGRGSGNLHHR